MNFCSEVVRHVEIPQSLPAVANLTKIVGNIILKDAVAAKNCLRVEGDLVWQGYFLNTDGEEVCLWEGAEFFQEELPVSDLRIRDPFMMEPEILGVTAQEISEESCALSFSVRWWEEENISEEEENFEGELQEIDESFRETMENFATSGQEDNIPDTARDIIEVAEANIITKPRDNVTEVCNDFREMRQKKEADIIPEVNLTPREEIDDYPKCPPYRLHYYRAQEGDTLDSIAERFSTSISRMRGVNELDEVGSIQGRMVRIL